MDTLRDNIEKLSAVCRAAGAHLPDEELKALQVGKVAEEAVEAMHALHGLKGLTTCGDDHTWSEVQNDLVDDVIAARLAMHYIDPTGARATFDEILHHRTQRGREACGGLATSEHGRRPHPSAVRPCSGTSHGRHQRGSTFLGHQGPGTRHLCGGMPPDFAAAGPARRLRA
ncbi:MazG-like family protein [Streptomyces sp. NPDC001787]|uniref:MazG-like family protein n=1 Tax=Streptomyces sp. NPDC001787 TaxID=3154523 RepID=UPI00331A3C44